VSGRNRRRVLPLLALLVVPGLSGCGEEPARTTGADSAGAASTAIQATSTDAYEAEVRNAIRGMQAFARELEALDAVDLKAAAPRLRTARSGFHDAVEEVAALTPPDPYKEAHESIVGSMRGLDAEMAALATAAATGKAETFLAADTRFQAAAQRVARAATLIPE
jgi:hypothetical protein